MTDEAPLCQHPPPKPRAGFFTDLIYEVETKNPKQFSLPNEIKNFLRNGMLRCQAIPLLSSGTYALSQSRRARMGNSSTRSSIARLPRSRTFLSQLEAGDEERVADSPNRAGAARLARKTATATASRTRTAGPSSATTATRRLRQSSGGGSSRATSATRVGISTVSTRR